jgi:hypothetical protein
MRTALAILAVGIAFMLASVAYDTLYAEIPHQDPTPSQQADYNGHRRVADGIFAIGVVPTAAGALAAGIIGGWVVFQKSRGRRT